MVNTKKNSPGNIRIRSLADGKRVRRPERAPGPGSMKHVHMFQGSRITELAACGLALDACWFGLETSINYLKNLN